MNENVCIHANDNISLSVLSQFKNGFQSIIHGNFRRERHRKIGIVAESHSREGMTWSIALKIAWGQIMKSTTHLRLGS